MRSIVDWRLRSSSVRPTIGRTGRRQSKVRPARDSDNRIDAVAERVSGRLMAV